ncbi:heme/hemin ABC transporter substrate-binding protein [Roseovarius sp. E0-M6]|uniref:heme/hemin ABC transporter substrate-binding protein n=1 Tax=Roseovarius sp. E0-M6 TaxID=3127118 RepID=UPI00300FD6C5
MHRQTITRTPRATRLRALLAATLSLGLFGTAAQSGESTSADVLSIGGSVTEIVYALDQEHRLVARDTTSTYPPEATTLPDVGYMRALSAEGVLSVAPNLVLAEEGAGPPETIDVLNAAGIAIVTVPDRYDAEGIGLKIRKVGAALGVADKADRLASRIKTDLNEAARKSDARADADRKRVLFVLSTEGGSILASGTGTAAHAIIGLAGGKNTVTGFEGYKRMTDEAVTTAAPDVILVMDREGNHAITAEGLSTLPAIRPTPAGRNGAVIRMNGLYLLGFGPRTAKAVADLSTALYGP